MKTRKRGLFAALAVVLLISAVLITTCTDPWDFSGGGIDAKLPPPPPGKGYIVIQLPPEAGRTILPDAPTTVYYGVAVASTGGGESYTHVNISGFSNFGTDDKEVLVVDPDEYVVTVSAYSDSDRETLIAVGAQTVDATANVTTSPAIALEKITNGTTTGTFTYSNITGVSNIDGTAAPVTVTISPYPNLTSTSFVAHTSGQPLASGYYWVKATATLAKHATATYLDLLHIYGNQDTEWTGKVITVNKNMYDLTYDRGYGTPSTIGTDTTGVTHGEGAVKHSTYGADPSRTDWDFVDWYEENLTTLWVFKDTTPDPPIAGTPLYKDSTVYAKWTPSGNTIDIEIEPYEAEDATITFSPDVVTFTQTQIFNNATGTNFSIVGSGVTVGTNGGWFYGDYQASSSATLTRGNVDAAPVNLQVIGSYVFTFVGEISGVPFSAQLTISITP